MPEPKVRRRVVRPVHVWLLWAAGAVFAISLLAAAVIDDPPTPPSSPPPLADRDIPPILGMNINVYHQPDMRAYLAAIDGIADLGLDTVQIVTPMFVENGAAPRVELLEGPDRGPTRPQLLELIRHAHGRGLRVHLMPQVNLYRPRGNEWRGRISPHDWIAWWASYRDATLSFLDLAAEERVELFVVGCELLSTQGPEHNRRWRDLIADCRARYDGLLTYSTNWDRFDRVLFWDALDLIGVNGYWDLTSAARDPARPTDDELLARWLRVREGLLAYAESQNRPILLTEVGYPSLRTGLKAPWNYLPAERVEDEAAQVAGYRAFLGAWGEMLRRDAGHHRPDPRVAGVCFYKWDIYTDGGPLDSRYGIAGKPAHELMRDWLRQGRKGTGPAPGERYGP